MNGMKDGAVVSVVVVAIYSFVVTAEVYRFHSNGAYPSAYCYDYVTNSGSAASNIACADKCGRNAQCQGFVYDSGSMLCSEIGVINNKYPDRRCQAGGTRFFAREGPTCNQRLVDGPGGVSNSQLTESSYYCAIDASTAPSCQPPSERYTSSWWARLSSTGSGTGGWAAGYTTHNEHIQVRFYQPTTVSSVVLTGHDPVSVLQYMYTTKFLFHFSVDCNVFEPIILENGDSMAFFVGNTDGYEVLTRNLPERVKALCFRIYPLTWFHYPALRFDLDGCY